MNESKTELLQGLNYVKGMLVKMQNMLGKYIALEQSLRATTKNISAKDAVKKDINKITFITTLAAAILLFPICDQDTSFMLTAVLFCTIVGALCRNSQKNKIAGFFVNEFMKSELNNHKGIEGNAAILKGLGYIFSFLSYACLLIVASRNGAALAVILLAVAVDAVLIYLKNKKINAGNRQVQANNQVVQGKRAEICGNYLALCDELERNAPEWFPSDYYNMDAVDFFIHAVRNGRADSVKEMVNLFEASSQHKTMMAYQQMQNQKLDQMISGQAQMIQNQNAMAEQLRFTNMMQAQMLSQLDTIARNTWSEKETAKDINRGIEEINYRTRHR